MARMKDVDVDFISLVTKGANKQKIQIYKADEEPETSNNDEVAGFFNVIKSFFTKEEIVKEEVKIKGFSERMTTSEVMDNIWRVNDTLISVMRDILDSDDIKDKEGLLSSAIDEHGAYLKTKAKGVNTVKKSDFFNDEGGCEDMKEEELQEIIKSAIEPINQRLDDIEKELRSEEVGATKEENTDKEENITKEGIAQVIKEALEPLSNRIDKIENHKGVSKQLEGQGQEVKKESTSIFAGINI